MSKKLVYPSASRNCQAILECLGDILPATGRILEIASGSGQHISALAKRYPELTWQPSDPEPEARASIAAWRHEENGDNLRAPLDIDVLQEVWWQAISGSLNGMMAINMIHIAPWEACTGLLKGAGNALKSGGFLYLYGPYMVDGSHTAPSNEAFDASLRARNPAWGIRDKIMIAKAAAEQDLRLDEMIPMPANNFSIVFRKS